VNGQLADICRLAHIYTSPFFQGFWLFFDRLYGRLKNETVNLSLKNAILCFGFGLYISYLQTTFAAGAFSLTTVTRFLRGEKVSGEPRLTALMFQLY